MPYILASAVIVIATFGVFFLINIGKTEEAELLHQITELRKKEIR